ncbi:hypothetical protein [Actinomadura atramentaria]|uniref:hypothetical protein n=1 Tax=Actinomadura atramentaria TaxID=1990 RepID=UPI00036EB69F|nr:hypothetical protein [Actinomadura atramentaria]
MEDIEKRKREIQDRIKEIDETLETLQGELGTNASVPDPGDFADAGQNLQSRAERDSQVQTLTEERGRLDRALEGF